MQPERPAGTMRDVPGRHGLLCPASFLIQPGLPPRERCFPRWAEPPSHINSFTINWDMVRGMSLQLTPRPPTHCTHHWGSHKLHSIFPITFFFPLAFQDRVFLCSCGCPPRTHSVDHASLEFLSPTGCFLSGYFIKNKKNKYPIPSRALSSHTVDHTNHHMAFLGKGRSSLPPNLDNTKPSKNDFSKFSHD